MTRDLQRHWNEDCDYDWEHDSDLEYLDYAPKITTAKEIKRTRVDMVVRREAQPRIDKGNGSILDYALFAWDIIQFLMCLWNLICWIVTKSFILCGIWENQSKDQAKKDSKKTSKLSPRKERRRIEYEEEKEQWKLMCATKRETWCGRRC